MPSKHISTILFLTIYALTCAQTPAALVCDSVLSQLPTKFKSGLIVYRDNDSTYFVFRALDYIKVNGNDTLPLIRSDSTDEKNFKRFSLTLTHAASSPCTLMEEVLYKGARLFPNSFVVKELFASYDVFVFKNTAGRLTKVDYTTKKKRGKNVKWQFSVIQKKNKNVLFKTAYGGIYN